MIEDSQTQSHLSDPGYRQWNAETRAFLLNAYEKMSEERELWAVETMKHIALVALSGLAGVFALLGAAKGNTPLIVNAAVWFTSSSVVCVIGMYLGALVRGVHLRHTGSLLNRLMANEIFTKNDFVEPKSIWWWNLAGNGTGWIAGICALVGGIQLYRALISTCTG